MTLAAIVMAIVWVVGFLAVLALLAGMLFAIAQDARRWHRNRAARVAARHARRRRLA